MTNLPTSTEDCQILLGQLIFTMQQHPVNGRRIRLPLTPYQAEILKMMLEDALYDPSACEKCGVHINFFDPATLCLDCQVDLGQAEYEEQS
jgi:hypothetical protein